MVDLSLQLVLLFILIVSLILYSICYYYFSLLKEYNTFIPAMNMSESVDAIKATGTPFDRYIKIDKFDEYTNKIKIFLKSLINIIESSAFILCIFIGVTIYLVYYFFGRTPKPSLFESHALANTYISDDFNKHMFY